MSGESLDTLCCSMTATGGNFVLLPKTTRPVSCLSQQFQQQQIQQL